MSQGFSDGYQYSPYHGSDSPAEFDKLSQTIGTDIQKVSQNVASMQRMVNQLGTAQDSDSLRSQLHKVQHYTNQLAKDTNAHLKELSTMYQNLSLDASEQKQYKMLKDRLANDFSDALRNLQTTQRQAAQKEKESVMRARAHSGLKGNPFANDNENSGGGSNLIDLARYPTQTQAQAVALQMEEEVNLELLREREQAVRKLESDITDVNHIFKDLATMVHEQGEVIDSIEANIEYTTSHVSGAVQELSKARKHQTSARKKMICLIVILLVVLAIIGLIIGIELRN